MYRHIPPVSPFQTNVQIVKSGVANATVERLKVKLPSLSDWW